MTQTLSEDELIRKHSGLVFVQAILFNPTSLSGFDDYMSAGRIGLLNAVRGYDGRTQFSTFATHCIRNEIIRESNKDKLGKIKKREVNPGDSATEKSTSIWELLPPGLSQDETDAIYYRVVENYTLQEIGDKIGCTKQWAKQILQKALEKVKASYE